jgi:hypothetical protein
MYTSWVVQQPISKSQTQKPAKSAQKYLTPIPAGSMGQKSVFMKVWLAGWG